MPTSSTLPAWWAALVDRAAQAPAVPRQALCIAGRVSPVGSIEAAVGERLLAAGMPIAPGADAWELQGEANAALERIAHWLANHGLAGQWRDELLAVTDADGTRVAAVERAAVRPLGIATFAVHLVGGDAQGGVWVQQRALDKATDPGLWDTLVGGLVAAHESAASALERETWEEAGLRLEELTGLKQADRISIHRPVRQGYMVEHIDVFEALVSVAQTPLNQDGEVERFERLVPAVLAERLAEGRFTLEAALILATSLRRRGLL